MNKKKGTFKNRFCTQMLLSLTLPALNCHSGISYYNLNDTPIFRNEKLEYPSSAFNPRFGFT